MSDRTLQVVWSVLALIAVGLITATISLFVHTRPSPAAPTGVNRIAYVSERDGTYRIFTSDIQGDGATRLLATERDELFPVCEASSASGDTEPRLAFLGLEFDAPEGHDTGPGVPGGVFVVGHKGGQPRKVSGHVERVAPVAPTWSPDGRQLAFAGFEDLNGDGQYTEQEAGIFVADLDTGEAKRAASALVAGMRLAWSPAGEFIIAKGPQANTSDITAFLVDLSTGEIHTHPDIAQITMACWSPDGTRVAAYSRADHKFHILDIEDDASELYAFDAPAGDVFDLLWASGTGGGAQNTERLYVVAGHDEELGVGPLYSRSTQPSPEEPWTRVTGSLSYVLFLSASLDGRYLAYTQFSSEQEGNIYVLEAGQEEPRLVTSAPGFEGLVTWIPGQ
ncbi:MAG: PD40 domain-containing protein [Anaerolineales bacterium]|nr:MAG: PD40 domain-containing protein [Anaerolineales bacterium]